MNGQSNDAAERSAHVLRGGAAPAAEGLPSIIEWKNEKGQTVGAARGVVELRARVAELEAQLAAATAAPKARRKAAHERAARAIERELLRWDGLITDDFRTSVCDIAARAARAALAAAGRAAAKEKTHG